MINCYFIFSMWLIFDLAKSRPIFIVEPPPDAAKVAVAPVSPFPAPVAAVFKPSIAVIVAVLTTMFSITFLLLLYAKHCKRGDGVVGYFGEAADLARAVSVNTGTASVSAARNSGIDRAVVESLPVFRFGSLSGEKDGLECAVCLNRFDPVEVLRLLPKCKHAFHVECVDTWLDAHSTCPLCRCRVDPEDVLLVDSNHHNPINIEPPEIENPKVSISARKSFAEPIRRISGRHSYAGVSSSTSHPPAMRRSCDGPHRKSETVAVSVGCFDRHRKDGMLMTAADMESAIRRLDHRIVIASENRWSDAHAADLLYLKRDSVMNEGRLSSAASALKIAAGAQGRVESGGDGRVVNNGRSVSEITGVNRMVLSDGRGEERQRQEREKRDGAVARWMAWISQSRPAVRSREDEEESEEEGSSNMKVILIRQQQ